MSTLSMSGEITQNPGDAISESGFSKAREVCSQMLLFCTWTSVKEISYETYARISRRRVPIL